MQSYCEGIVLSWGNEQSFVWCDTNMCLPAIFNEDAKLVGVGRSYLSLGTGNRPGLLCRISMLFIMKH